MNIEIIRADINAKYVEAMDTLAFIEQAGIQHMVTCIDGKNIFMIDCDDLKDILPIITEKVGPYKLEHYYHSSGRLAVSYSAGGFLFILFLPLDRLAMVSGGKCTLTTTTEPKIVCNLEA